MDQVRVIFASLVPALLVVASGQGFPQRLMSAVHLRSRIVVLCRHSGRAPLSRDLRHAAWVARGSNRRLVIQAAGKDFSLDTASKDTKFPRFARLDQFSLKTQHGHCLTRPWQFQLRAALEPRAPSSVS